MAFDYSRLKARIRQVYGTQGAFAKDLNIGRVSLSLRLNNKAEFSQEEINKSCDLLNLGRKDIPAYFFTEEVQKHEL